MPIQANQEIMLNFSERHKFVARVAPQILAALINDFDAKGAQDYSKVKKVPTPTQPKIDCSIVMSNLLFDRIVELREEPDETL